MLTIPVDVAAPQLDELIDRATRDREPIALVDHGQVAALLVSPRVIADLKAAIALAERRRQSAEGGAGPESGRP
ncbi:type II toxin-antitoxin system prevent-host-death family antitoxin [Streptomyces sp. NPDC003717]|uniref:type II toxin-antitoxin system prevent-host-death family antitoxin n=1 Tax=Streptomyces sp. NPDC003717 TaxID=3154276 RepID=UPI0033B72C40